MTQQVTPQTSSSLPDVFSQGLTAIFERAKPAIVQVNVSRRGGGTGIVWRSDGLILTNNHVVPNDQARVEVVFADGRTLPAKVLHHQRNLDLAVLKVDATDLPFLSAGDSGKLRIGELVFAIGHPWGQRWVVTAGVVSNTSAVKVSDGQTVQYIRSDVQLAPGNSGGPLLNADGDVVGINAMILGGDLSVAIPSAVVSAWLAGLTKRSVRLGLQVQQVDNGLLVVDVGTQSGVLVGDILLELAGQTISDSASLRRILQQQPEGTSLPLKVQRGGQAVTTSIRPQIVENLL